MKRLLLILLLAGSVQAGHQVITSLPYVPTAHSTDLWDTLFFVDTDTNTSSKITWNPPSTAREGILFSSVSYFRVLFANDSIVWGGDPTCVQSRVIRISGTSNHIEIIGKSSAKMGYLIYSNPYFGDTVADTSYNLTRSTITLPRDTAVRANPQGIYGGGSYIVVRNMYIRVGGFGYDDGDIYLGSSCINMNYGGVSNEFANNTLINNSVMFYGRDNYPARCIRVTATTALSGSDTMNAYIHDNTMTSNGTQCIVTLGVGKYLIFHNTMTIDGRNAMEDAGAVNEMWCWTHAFCVIANRLGRGSRIHGNTVRSGSTYRGGQGMFIVAPDTSTTHTGYVQVDSNDVRVHGGNSSFYQYYQNMGSAFKIRAHVKHIKVFGNYFAYTCDTTKWRATGDGGPAYMPIGAAIEYQFYSPYVTGAYDTWVYNNTCSTDVVTNLNTPYYMVAGIRFSSIDFPSEDTTFKWYGNKFVGHMNWAYTFGTNAGVDEPPGGVANVRVWGDTINQLTWDAGVMAVDNSACRSGFYSNNNVVQDVRLIAGTDGEPTYYGNSTSGRYTPQSGINNLYHQRTPMIYVRGSNGLPVVGATVTIVDHYGTTQGSYNTDNHGYAAFPSIPYAWYSINVADLTAYNPMTITAAYYSPTAGYFDTHTINLAWNVYQDTLDLAVAGTGTWSTGEEPPIVVSTKHKSLNGKIHLTGEVHIP